MSADQFEGFYRAIQTSKLEPMAVAFARRPAPGVRTTGELLAAQDRPTIRAPKEDESCSGC